MLASMADSRASKALSLVFNDEAATARFGAKLARLLKPGDTVALTGGLGSGKTALARAVVRAFQPEEDVPSPTFTLIQQYPTPNFVIWHVDLYRLTSAREVRELGLDEAIDSGGALLVEWPERGGNWLPDDRLDITLSIGTNTGERRAEIIAYGSWIDRLDALR